VTKFQLHNTIKALLSASRRQNDLAEPGTETFNIHMSAAIILAELAHVAHDIYCSTPNREGVETHQKDTDNATT
jgi:hypothetical protein